MKNLYKNIFTLLSLVIIGVLLSVQGVAALSPQQKALYDKGVMQFDLEDGSGQCSASGGSFSLSGNSNQAKAFNFLIGQGLTDYQAAGVVGNLMGESRMIPTIAQGSQTIKSFSEVTANRGFGIAQWTTSDRQQAWGNFARDKKMDPLSLELQLMYLWYEFETNPGYGLEEITKSPDLRQATWIFLAYFERPKSVEGYTGQPTQPTGGAAKGALDERVQLANEVTGGGGSPTSTASAVESCQDGASSGAKYSANGYTFPLQISRKGITDNKPVWCFESTTNCHHDYNASDIFAPTGTPVLATRGGRVASAKDVSSNPSAIGTRIAIMGDDGWLYYYAHMGSGTLKVRDGQQIEAGTELGRVGTSENAAGTDPHLHIDRLPGKDYQQRPSCSGAACSGYPMDNIQALMNEIFKAVK